MQVNVLNELRKDKKMYDLLKQNSYWLKELNRNPGSLKDFKNHMKEKYHLRTTDKISDAIDNIDIIRQKNNGYILPTSLAKRDNVEKYYNIDNKILGEGSYGQVCIGTKNGEKFAIKRMKKDKLIDLKPLLLEAEISLSINHPNIITYYEIFEDLKYK